MKWRFTGFYGEPNVGRYHLSWDILRNLKSQPTLPWLCCGDLNALLFDHEKEIRCSVREWQLRDFRSVLSDVQLDDMGFEGPCFTWCNRGLWLDTVRCRLDRILGDRACRLRFQ
ncbi:UNVERIFIED_CONTAM: hypothetical protein Sindi_0788800 [Sesamum indicum]